MSLLGGISRILRYHYWGNESYVTLLLLWGNKSDITMSLLGGISRILRYHYKGDKSYVTMSLRGK